MKKRLIKLLSMFVFVGFIASCSDDPINTPVDTNPPKANKFFPATKGSVWTYNEYAFDKDSKRTGAFSTGNVVAIDRDTTLAGQKAYVFQPQDMTGQKDGDNEYYYTRQNQIYWYSKLLPELNFELPVNISEKWYLIADSKGTKWQLHKETLKDVNFSEFGVVLNGDFTIDVTKEDMEEVFYGENEDIKVSANKFKFEFSFTGTATKSPIPPINLPFTITVFNYYADDIGLVKQYQPSVTVGVLTFQQTFFGFDKILTTYVKP